VSAMRNSQDAKWGGATCQLPSLTALLSVLPVVFICLLFAFVPVPDVSAASAYLADENGQTEINVDVEDEFYVVLYVVDITDLAGYECKITVSGPATPIDSAVHGAWFADNHTIFDGIYPVPADYHTAMLLSPMSISGSGAVVVFTLRADDDGIVAINIDSEYFLFGDKYAEVIEVDLPSTLYVTVGTGEGYQGGESENELSFNPQDIDIYVNGAYSGTESGTINEPYNTIQEAISAANGGELIGVAVGEEDDLTYTVNLVIGKTVHLRGGLDPSTWEPVTDRASIISAQSATSPTVEYTTTGTAGSITGFTITDGRTGIKCGTGTSPTIEGNIITANSGAIYGGGIYCVGSTNSSSVPRIIRNTITGNSAHQGGGIRCYNYEVSSGTSGKIPLMEKNTISGNIASSFGGGIAISHCNGANMRYCIANNYIASNSADDAGGAIHCYNSTNISIVNNTITANDVEDNSSALTGGGLWIECSPNNSASVVVLNTILWKNESDDSGGQRKWDEIALENGGNGASVTVDYTDLHGALAYISTGIFADGNDFDAHHNIDADPLLTQDWRLGSGSPCIDKGTCQLSTRRAPYEDKDSRIRRTGGDGTYDIGAHEYGATGSLWATPGDANLDCRVNILDMIIIRNKLGQSPCDGSNWQADVNNDGRTIDVLDLLFTRTLLGTRCP